MNPLEPPLEDWIGPLQRIGEERRLSWPAIERGIEIQILAGDHPRVLMCCNTTSPVGQEVRAALGPHPRMYHLEEQQIPWTDAAAVAAAFSVQKIDADLVAIVCGGGEELSALSDRRVIEAVAHQVPIPIVLVVDQIDDRPLIQDVVYQAFPTPTALGTWLAGRVTEAQRRRKRGMRAVLVVANRARGLVTSVRNYASSFTNHLNK